MSVWFRCGAVAIGVLMVAVAEAQETPPPAQPQEEHKWLQQLVGEWETHGRMETGPGQPAFECKGKESTRSLGGLWIISEGEAEPMGMKVQSVLTLGYDGEKEKFVGTWIDSMYNHMWKYEGTLDESEKVLTLMTEGPSFTNPKETAKYKEVLEMKDQDHKVFSSYVQGEGGEWIKFVTVESKRVK
jgi:hypothetical protein